MDKEKLAELRRLEQEGKEEKQCTNCELTFEPLNKSDEVCPDCCLDRL